MSKTHEWRNAFLEQARSDWQAYYHMQSSALPACHSLHYLQMSTEKLAKAAQLAGGMNPEAVGSSHLAFTKFLHLAVRNRNLRQEMGMSGLQLKMHFASLLPLADAIERLAPALSRGGINPEYPWQEPDGLVRSPATYQFQLLHDLQTPKGVNLLKNIALMLKHFEKLFA